MQRSMKYLWRSFVSISIFSALLGILLAPTQALACACGCSIFDVGMNGGLMMMPVDTDSGWSVWARYSYLDQNQNFEGTSKAPASDNKDKEIKTSFFTVGGQYMINRNWSVMAELPMFNRSLTTTDDGSVSGAAGSVYTAHMFDMGDLVIQGMYTGFFSDLSTGISLGLKLPTGNYSGPTGPLGGSQIDRDTLPGTGSTDVILGGYHAGGITADHRLGYFLQAQYHIAIATRNAYRPGNELDAAVGLGYSWNKLGFLSRLTPVMQLLGSDRMADSGANSDPLNSGYARLIVAPGLELRFSSLKIFADVEIPIYQWTNAATGEAAQDTSGQLVASAAYKVQVGYDF